MEHTVVSRSLILKRRKPLRRVSKKRATALVLYRELKAEYLAINPTCECCNKRQAQDIHHKLPLGRGGKLCDVSIFMGVCRPCHNLIHNDPLWAKQSNHLYDAKPQDHRTHPSESSERDRERAGQDGAVSGNGTPAEVQPDPHRNPEG